jgi:hypothetical protein
MKEWRATPTHRQWVGVALSTVSYFLTLGSSVNEWPDSRPGHFTPKQGDQVQSALGAGSNIPGKSDKMWIIDCPPPQPQKKLYFSVFFFAEAMYWKLFLSSSSPRTSCGVAGRPVPVVEQFRCSYQWKGPSDVFYARGDPADLRNSKYEPPKIEGWV